MAVEPYETAALAVEEPEAATRRRLLAEIAACRADPMKMLMHQRPITMAIMMALTRPASEVIDLTEESFTTPAATAMSAIEALGIAAVGSALRGSTNAAAFITERLEGRAMHHGGETDQQADAAREDVQRAIEEVVRGFTEARLDGPDDTPGDGAQVVEGSASTAPAPEPRTSGRPAPQLAEQLMPDGDGRTNGQANGAGWRDRESPRGH